MRRIWNDPRWKKNAEAKKDRDGRWCRSCGKECPEGATVQHLFHRTKIDTLNKVRSKFYQKLWDEGKEPTVEQAIEPLKSKYQVKCCPKCKRWGNINARKTLTPKYKCYQRDCKHEFEEFATRFEVEHPDIKDFKRRYYKALEIKYADELQPLIDVELVKEEDHYLSCEGAEVWCKKCAYMYDVGRKKICKECKTNYHPFNYDRCWDCNKKRYTHSGLDEFDTSRS